MAAERKIDVSIVVPLYNEEDSFAFLVERLNGVIEKADFSIEVILVDDGSRDKTSMLMSQLALKDPNYQAVFLSRNFGHQIAVTAGLAQVNGTQGVMVIDGDLQDPPELLFDFYERFKAGADVIYAVRKNRKESWFKKLCYHYYYRLQTRVSNVDIQIDSGDFCFMRRDVVDILNKMPEESRYIRGLRSWIGYKQEALAYDRDKRIAGEPKYGFKMLFRLAYNGIFNFSELPIKIITWLGVFSVGISTIYLAITLISRYLYGNVPTGFPGLLIAIIMFGGVQLLSLGIIGEYVIRIFFQVKKRPLFIVKNKIVNQEVV